EPEGVALAEGLLEWLKSNNLSHASPPASWALIPCLNPDGFLRCRRTNGTGVDLNRNYPSNDWSPDSKTPRYFPCLNAGSESEIRSLVQWMKQFNPRLVIHFHSWKPCIVYAGDTAHPTAQEFERASGYPVVPDIGYPTPGSLSRFGLENGIP